MGLLSSLRRLRVPAMTSRSLCFSSAQLSCKSQRPAQTLVRCGKTDACRPLTSAIHMQLSANLDLAIKPLAATGAGHA